MSLGEGPAARFGSTPINGFLGMRLEGVGEDRAEVVLPVRPEFFQEEGVVHGGILTLLADTTAVYLALPRLDEGEHITSVELKVNFLRPGRQESGPLRATARPVRVGKRVIVVESRVRQGSEELLIGLFTYLRLPPRDTEHA